MPNAPAPRFAQIDVEKYEPDYETDPSQWKAQKGKHAGHVCQYFDVVDREDAIRLAVLAASTRDVVVIAGKGHEDYIEIGTTKFHFDDRETAANAIRFAEETKEVMPWLRGKWEYPMVFDGALRLARAGSCDGARNIPRPFLLACCARRARWLTLRAPCFPPPTRSLLVKIWTRLTTRRAPAARGSGLRGEL